MSEKLFKKYVENLTWYNVELEKQSTQDKWDFHVGLCEFCQLWNSHPQEIIIMLSMLNETNTDYICFFLKKIRNPKQLFASLLKLNFLFRLNLLQADYNRSIITFLRKYSTEVLRLNFRECFLFI